MTRQQLPTPFLRVLRRLRAAFWQRRVAQWLVRAAWLALLAPTTFMAGYLWLGWSVRWYYWVYPMLLIGALALLWSMRPIGLHKIAHRLDHRLKLRSQLITAFEVSQSSKRAVKADNLVIQRLLQATVDIIVGLRGQVRFLNRNLWLEIQALIGVAAIFTALVMLDALTPRFPNATAVDLPAAGQEPVAEEVLPPDARLAPPPFQPEIQTQAVNEDQLQRALQILADSLRDQSITRSISEAIDRNDLGEAAEGLRRLADQLEDVSEDGRAQLGDNMQDASDKIGEGVPNLTQPLDAGNEALDANDLGGASQALEELAEALDQIEESPQESAQVEPDSEGGMSEDQAQAGANQDTQEEQEQPDQQDSAGGGEGESDADSPDQPTEDERLAVEGDPLELEPDPPIEPVDDSVLQPAELDAQASDELTEDSPFARQALDAAADLGPDPLTYPWEKREIIRRYFTP